MQEFEEKEREKYIEREREIGFRGIYCHFREIDEGGDWCNQKRKHQAKEVH